MNNVKRAIVFKNILLVTVLLAFILSTLIVPAYKASAKSVENIAIDPGHGGIDLGAVLDGVEEKEVALDISKRLKTYLGQKGYNVILTRDGDVSLDKLSKVGNNRVKRDLNARINIIDNSGSKLFVSVHVNSDLSYTKANGSIVYYNNKFPESKTLAYNIQKELNNIKVNNKRRTLHDPQTAQFYMLKNSKIPGILIETAFISNKQERELMKTEEFRDSIAKAIAHGIENMNTVTVANVANNNEYLVFAYSKKDSYAESEELPTIQKGYSWIKATTSNGIVYSKDLPKKIFGVVLEGYPIDFNSDYVVKKTGKDVYDDKVLAIQKTLNSLGYRLTQDGHFGLETFNAILKFQKSIHLKADGVVGEGTFEKLVSEFK